MGHNGDTRPGEVVVEPPAGTKTACALGGMRRNEARPRLIRLLANTPSPEAIDAFARIADDDGVVLLGQRPQPVTARPGLRP